MNTGKRSGVALAVAFMSLFGCTLATGISQAAVNVPQISRNLSVGSSGEDVRSLQKFLNSNGYAVAASGAGSSGSETSLFGNATKAALARFQAANGISATGYLGPQTRALLDSLLGSASSASAATAATSVIDSTISALETENASLKQQISSLQSQISSLIAAQTDLQSRLSAALKKLDDDDDDDDDDGPTISAIAVSDGGEEGYIDAGDTIKITFSEAIDPESIDSDLEKGSYVTGISYSNVGGVSVTSAGKVVVKGIASFDMGSVEDSGTFTSKLALNSTEKTLSITLTSGSDIKITDEDFNTASQTGGYVEDEDGNEMDSDSGSVIPSGTFGGEIS